MSLFTNIEITVEIIYYATFKGVLVDTIMQEYTTPLYSQHCNLGEDLDAFHEADPNAKRKQQEAGCLVLRHRRIASTRVE